MKIVLNILGIICLPIGALWTLQGLKIINTGAMAGHSGMCQYSWQVIRIDL